MASMCAASKAVEIPGGISLWRPILRIRAAVAESAYAALFSKGYPPTWCDIVRPIAYRSAGKK